jgi:hypothetical protein
MERKVPNSKISDQDGLLPSNEQKPNCSQAHHRTRPTTQLRSSRLWLQHLTELQSRCLQCSGQLLPCRQQQPVALPMRQGIS